MPFDQHTGRFITRPPGRPAYFEAVRVAEAMKLTCDHGQVAGNLVRPWTLTPGCALCRRAARSTWKWMTDSPEPVPDNVVSIRKQRTLW